MNTLIKDKIATFLALTIISKMKKKSNFER